ncbi:hypothetical protein L1887_50252 [Cichorium endivia]|nr:hypothetical protein L1887_50252 [Cichorium endivia]
MSGKRLNKRQLREQQELDELADVPLPKPAAASTRSPFQQLNEPSDDGVSDEEEEDEEIVPTSRPAPKSKPTATSLFAALGDQGGDDADQDDEDDASDADNDISTQQTAAKSSKKKNKKKKKKAAAVAAAVQAEAEDAATVQSQDTEAKSAPAKSSAKKAPTKKSSAQQSGTPTGKTAAKSKDVADMSIDEFDALLASQASLNNAEAARNPSSSSAAASATAGRVSAFRTHLSLDPRHLDPAIELRRQFGSAAIKAYQNEAGGAAGGGRASSGARARAQANNPNLKVRSLLCTPKDYWPPISRSFTGMSMDVVDSATHGRVCVWKHSRAYRQVQMQFLQAVRSYDPNALMALLRVYPYHIDTLLQLSEYSRHQGDLGQAADFNDRALFALERCASPYFTSCLSSTSSGPPVVSFNKIENRAFYLALHRNIGFLGRRGTWRTALEWAKLLLGLGQDGEDHHAALLWIDFLAIKSRQHRWLLELVQTLDEQRARRGTTSVAHVDELSVPARTVIDDTDKQLAGEGDGYAGTLDWCVGLAYARALAYRALEREESDKAAAAARSRAALRLAIARFPGAVPLLCNKAGVDLPDKIATHPLFQLAPRYGADDTLGSLLTHIYVLRSESLWKEPGYGEWLRSTAMELAETLVADYDGKRKAQPAVASHNTRQGIYRHVLVSDLPDAVRQQLIAYLPPSITGSSEQMDAFDPVPPRAGVSDADGLDVTRYDDEYFAPVLADTATSRGPAQAGGEPGAGIMQAFRRALQGMAGVQGWDAAMENMDDETREDVMAQIMHMAEAAQGNNMPGAFGDADDVDDEAEAAEGEQPRGARPFAALRAALDAVWGGNPPAPTGDDVQDDDNDAQH